MIFFRGLLFEIKLFLSRVIILLKKEERKLRHLAKFERYTPGIFHRNNVEIRFPDSASFVFTYRELFINGIYNFPSSNREPYIIDCGANIGLSIICFKEQYPFSKIVAFEPEKKIFSILEKNVAAFNFQNIELINKAVWSKETSLSFDNEGADANRILLLDNFKSVANSYYEIEAVRLSPFLDREVDFLKLDIEGAELEVMKEISSNLFNVKRIFIEYHSFINNKQELDVILKILTENNFRYFIASPVQIRKSPFLEKGDSLSFDLLLNIYAERI